MSSTAVRQYREAAQWVDESRVAANAALEAFRADRTEENLWALEVANNAYLRDMDIRMKRADAVTDEEYTALMRELRGAR